MYIILASDGKEYGPVDLQTLQIWASQGRITATTLIRNPETGEYLSANQMPSLQQTFNVPPIQVSNNLSPTYPALPYARPGYIQVVPGTHSPVVAVLLSLFCIMGLGQMYNRQVGKGFVVLGVSVVLALLTVGFSVIVTYPLAAIDAGLIGGRLNRGEPITEWQWF